MVGAVVGLLAAIAIWAFAFPWMKRSRVRMYAVFGFSLLLVIGIVAAESSSWRQ